MRRILVIDHHDSYTWNLVHLVAAVTGSLPDVIQHDDADADARWRSGYTHLVLSPGPGSVEDDADFAIGRTVLAQAQVPVLGVCLGLQGLVVACGGTVDLVEPAHGEVAQVQHVGKGVFRSLPQGFAAVRYHSLAAIEIPACLQVTAWCDGSAGRFVMGVQHRHKPLHGVQFHPESVLTGPGHHLLRNFLEI